MGIQGITYFTQEGGYIFNDNQHGILGKTPSGDTDIGTSQENTLISGASKTTFLGVNNVVEITSNLKKLNSGGMVFNNQGNAFISRDMSSPSKTSFGTSTDIIEIIGTKTLFSAPIETTSNVDLDISNKIRFNSDDLNYIDCATNIGGTGKTGVNLIGNCAIKLGLSGTPTGTNESSLVLEGQNVNVVGDIRTLGDMYCEGKYRILSPAAFLPAPETQYDNYIDYGLAFATGVNVHGFRGVEIYARHPTTNQNDVRFYVSAGTVNMRVSYAQINGQLVQTSDDRLKTNEIDFTFNSLEIINRMKPKQYKKYNEDGEYLYMELGMVAQDTWNSVKDNELLRDLFVRKIDYDLESNFKENGDLVEDQQKTNDKGEIETNYVYVNYISYVPISIQSVLKGFKFNNK